MMKKVNCAAILLTATLGFGTAPAIASTSLHHEAIDGSISRIASSLGGLVPVQSQQQQQQQQQQQHSVLTINESIYVNPSSGFDV